MRALAFATHPGRGVRAAALRFRLFHAYVAATGRAYDAVGWFDVRDVYFQRDPFERVDVRAVHAFTETAVLTLAHKRKVYLDWSRTAWGYACDDAYESYERLPPVNLGVVVGGRRCPRNPEKRTGSSDFGGLHLGRIPA